MNAQLPKGCGSMTRFVGLFHKALLKQYISLYCPVFRNSISKFSFSGSTQIIFASGNLFLKYTAANPILAPQSKMVNGVFSYFTLYSCLSNTCSKAKTSEELLRRKTGLLYSL